ncbi:condensation domain-containing protein [Micromonospora sp. CA-249363]|uniref:condensation domain-containing protein n=1 Tax=Micromonospora sp. CA-249363 TaxID=3239963 RepID=UPI003D8C2E0F
MTQYAATDVRTDGSGQLTASQREIWALARRTREHAALSLSYALLITGPLDVPALTGAFDDVLLVHEPLRTLYPAVAGEPAAVVLEPAAVAAALDLVPRTVPGLADAGRIADEQRSRRFDLSTEVPIRAALLLISPGADSDAPTAEPHHVLLLTLHHIAADGWSLHTLGLALSKSYAARRDGRPAALEPALIDCGEHARDQQDWLASAAGAQEVDWWRARLRAASPRCGLPSSAAADGTGTRLRRQVVALPDDLVNHIREVARHAVASPFVLLLAAFKALLLSWTGVTEPIVGTLAANRPTAPSATVLGAHYNPLLTSTDLRGDPSLAECLLRTSATMLAVLDHQRLPFPALLNRLGTELNWADAAPPEAMFLMDRYPMDALRLAGCDVIGLYLDDETTGVPAATPARLTFFTREVNGALTLSALYPPDALSDGAVAQALQVYQEILIDLCESPQTPVSTYAALFGEPLPDAVRPAPGELTLRPVTELAPVEVLSPVGAWSQWYERRSP